MIRSEFQPLQSDGSSLRISLALVEILDENPDHRFIYPKNIKFRHTILLNPTCVINTHYSLEDDPSGFSTIFPFIVSHPKHSLKYPDFPVCSKIPNWKMICRFPIEVGTRPSPVSLKILTPIYTPLTTLVITLPVQMEASLVLESSLH